MLDLFKNSSNQQNFTNYTILELLPDAMPQHIIVINDIVYTIMTYGMPIFNEKDNCFEPFDQGKKADLLVYRKEDVYLAERINLHINRIVLKYATK